MATTPSFALQAAAAGNYPALDFNKREKKLLASVKAYLDAGLSTASIADAAITLAKLAPGVSPSHIIKLAGSKTSVGGAASEAFTITGLATTDIVMLTLKDNGPSNVTILEQTVAANTLTVVFSANPGAGAIVNYAVLRAAV